MGFTFLNEHKKRIYKVYLLCEDTNIPAGWKEGDGGNTADGREIGVLEEMPSLKTAAGDTVKLHNGKEVVISEVADFEANLLGVDPDNYDALKDLINMDTTITFIEDKVSFPKSKVVLPNSSLYPALEAVGNSPLKVLITSKKETEPGEAMALSSLTD